MEPCHLFRLGNGGQIHDFVLLQKQVAVLAQLVDGPRRRRDAHLGKALGQNVFHVFTSQLGQQNGDALYQIQSHQHKTASGDQHTGGQTALAHALTVAQNG